MKEIRNIIAEYDKVDDKSSLVLATVVKVRGSSYRSPGARMLIRNDGRWTGSISGGCLEGDALRKARTVMRSEKPQLVTYDTMDDENNSLGVGLGCNGIIDVLLEPLNHDNNAIDRIKYFTAFEKLSVVATIFRSEKDDSLLGQQLWINDENGVSGNILHEILREQVSEELILVAEGNKAKTKCYNENQLEVFFEILEPSIDLQIYGAGFDAKPVVDMAKTLGWNVSVFDECIAHLAPINFPNADAVSLCQREASDFKVKIKPYSAAVLMSHSFEYDYSIFKRIITTDIKYIGILGPKKRAVKIFDKLKDEGIQLPEMHRIHSPIGLDIGAETPEEIALSIVTEIQAKFSNRSGGFLKYRKSPIHHRDGKDDQIFKEIYLNSEPQKVSNSEN